MSESAEDVSVIIPARNEEAVIARAVRSVAGQAGVREIVVVDDHSEDRTGEILEGLRAEIPLLRVVASGALPENWTGKSFALATGAESASGRWLLFTDADTVHRPGSLAALVERAERERVDLLSLSPAQRLSTWWEKAVIPVIYVRLARLYRFVEVSDPHSPAAAANGQFILIRRETYQRAGGHRAVAAAVLEDVELARRVKADGGRLLFLPGAAWVETRMYRSFGQMWEGWTKNLYLLLGGSLAGVAKALAEAVLLDVALPLGFLAACVATLAGHGSTGLAGLGVACLLGSLWRHWRYFAALERLSFASQLAGAMILGNVLFALLALNSLRAYRWRGRVSWKGRSYPARCRAAKGKL
jgi:cellulose synthase/poly-beta-1,6-N-acetylglucosamine synthase-like glycosyltransferase